MAKFLDLTGQKFGRLEVISFSHLNKYRERMWFCRCDCGKEITVRRTSLVSGATQSCGCITEEKKIIFRERIHEQGNIKDRVGLKFGHLTIENFLYKVRTAYKYELYYNCKCDCGNNVTVRLAHLQGGHNKTCGKNCIYRKLKNKGLTASNEYNIHSAMLQRCNNIKNKHYQDYGGRDVTVCERWQGLEGFNNFYKDMGPKPEGLTLDRIDNNGNYCKENCRWVSIRVQNNNKRNNIRITSIVGETYSLSKWANLLGCSSVTLGCRLKRGWKEKCCVCLPMYYSTGKDLKEYIMLK